MFRKGRTSDYLGSYLRQHVLASVEDREIDLKAIKDDTGSKVLTDSNNPLGPLQDAQGGHHWEGLSFRASLFQSSLIAWSSSDARSVARLPLGDLLEIRRVANEHLH